MLASALAFAAFSAAMALAFSSGDSTISGLATTALAGAASVSALVLLLAFFAVAFLAVAALAVVFFVLAFGAALAFVLPASAFLGSAAARSSSAAAVRSLALALLLRRRAGAFLVSAFELTSLTSPSELASRTMSGWAVLVAAGLMVDEA